MFTLAISQAEIDSHRADVRSKLGNSLYCISQSLRAKYPPQYAQIEDAFACFTCLRDSLNQYVTPDSGPQFPNAYAAYLAAEQVLSRVTVTDRVNSYFAGIKESFDGSNPETLDRLLKVLSSAIRHLPSEAPSFIPAYLLWLREQALLTTQLPGLDELVREAHSSQVTIHSTTYRGFSVQDTLPPTGWHTIGGYEHVKSEFKRICLFLRSVDSISREYGPLASFVPKGTLLIGPPGTGKYLMARTLCAEAGIPCHSFDQADVGSSYVNKTATNLRELIDKASDPVLKKAVPAALIFIDEIESIAKKRGSGGSEEDAKTVTTFAIHMDGRKKVDGVFFLGATNRPDILDPALTRPGRFSSWLEMGFPDDDALRQIYLVHHQRISRHNKNAFADCRIDDLVAASSNKDILSCLPPGYYMDVDLCKKGFTGAVIADIFDRAYREHVAVALSSGEYAPLTTQDLLEVISRFRQERGLAVL